MWELVAGRITASGGEILLNCRVVALECQGGTVRRLRYKTGAGEGGLDADYVISSMPIKDLVSGMEASPDDVREVADGLVYRDFVTAGLLLKRLRIRNETAFKTVNGIIPDNWIYVQESDVRVGRLQIFNNWSPYMVADPYTVWIGMEYFCNEGDEIWSLSDGEFLKMAASELQKIGVADAADVMDGTVVRLPKTYPAYFGTYNRFETVRKWLDGFENLFLVGRNGMHRYNNMDHSMLTAMEAAACIIDGTASKDGIWAVNAEEEYHEEKSGAQ
jgi:protoporphyrinogen oxidase